MSQANNPITLKIHHGDDIRRLHLEKLDWEELTQLISSTYPTTSYTLKYRDTDDDLVTMVAQQDLQDAYDMSQGDVLHLFVVDKVVNATADQPTTASNTSAAVPDVDVKLSHDDLASQLSHDEISTLLSECLSDPTVITAVPAFLTTFIDQLTANMSHATPLSTSWAQSLQQHTTIRDHVILSVLLPRMDQALTRADSNHLATRIPTHLFPMVKSFLPMLPMFLPSVLPLLTKFMSDATATTSTDAQQQAQGYPFANNSNPLMSLLSGMQQAPSATSPSSVAPTSNSPAAPFNPLMGMLAPLLAGVAANSAASTSPTNNHNTPANNPLASLMEPRLAANGNQANNNPLAALLQQFAQPASTSNNTDTASSITTNINTNHNTTPDYTEQLAQLDSLGIGNHEINVSLLKQCDGSVERVVQLLAME